VALRAPPGLKRSALPLGLLALGAAAAAYAAAGYPGLTAIPGWFYRPTHPGLGFTTWAAAGGALALASFTFVWRARRAGVAVALLTLGSVALQAAALGSSADGLEKFWTRLYGGHGEFLAVAHRESDALSVLQTYDARVERDELGHFPPSKPPGALAFYFALDRLGERVASLPLQRELVRRARATRARGHAAGAALALWLLPLLTALLAPLALALARAMGARHGQARLAGILTATTPTVLLISHHLDGALYPLVGTAAMAAVVQAAQTRSSARRLVLGLAGGTLFALGLYTSFSLLPLGVATLAALGLRWRAARRDARPFHGVEGVAWAALAFVATAALLMVFLRFDPQRRFLGAMAYHREWKAGVPTTLWRAVAPLEFALWLGAPLLFTVFGGALGGARDGRGVGVWALGMLAITTAVSGTNEVARLWIFLVPLFAVAAAMARRWAAEEAAALVVAQLAVAVALGAAGPW